MIVNSTVAHQFQVNYTRRTKFSVQHESVHFVDI